MLSQKIIILKITSTTNVARRFLNLVEKHFSKEQKLHNIFNKNTLNVSYSYSQNMTQIINSPTEELNVQKVYHVTVYHVTAVKRMTVQWTVNAVQ